MKPGWLGGVGARELEVPEVLANQKREKFWGWVEPPGLFLAGNDDGVALRFKNGCGYEEVSRALWRCLCARGGIAVNVGGHDGLFSLEAYRAGARYVVTVEPNPVNFARCVMNLRHAGLNAEGVYYGAAGDETRVDDLLVKGYAIFVNAGGRVGMGLHHAGEHYPVRVARLDDLIPELVKARVGVVKIDVEGWAARVLGGMPRILAGRPDLLIEVTENGLDEILAPLGYRFWRVDERGGEEAFTEIPRCEELVPLDINRRNVFCSVKEFPDA